MMEELKKHIDRLFANHKETREVRELKEEILSNLEAKAADYMQEGISPAEAAALAAKSMESVDFLIEGNQKFCSNRFKAELAQMALLYTIIAWVITIPVRLTFMGAAINNLLTIAAIVCGFIYLAFVVNKGERYLDTVANFVLIDNLEVLAMNFEDTSFTISRGEVGRWYGVALASLREEENWQRKVQGKLADQGYVESFIEAVFQ